jgi:long-chain acyl-CoA synthetase
VVYLHPGQSIDEAGLCEFLAHRIAGFKVPAKIWFEPESLPRLGTEKIDKVSLRAKYRAIWQEAVSA